MFIIIIINFIIIIIVIVVDVGDVTIRPVCDYYSLPLFTVRLSKSLFIIINTTIVSTRTLKLWFVYFRNSDLSI